MRAVKLTALGKFEIALPRENALQEILMWKSFKPWPVSAACACQLWRTYALFECRLFSLFLLN